MPEYLTPGVFINETPRLPPHIVSASSHIAIFIGYTERQKLNGLSLLNIPTKINSLPEFERFFGGDALHQFNIDTTQGAQVPDLTLANKGYSLNQCSQNFLLYRSIVLFFNNGGSTCYVVSVGHYGANISPNSLLNGLKAITHDIPASIVLIPDAVALDNQNDCTAVQHALLSHCSQKSAKRFAIVDIYQGYLASNRANQNDCIDSFCHNIGNQNLSYAAAYYPWLNTSIVGANDLHFTAIKAIAKLKTLLSAELNIQYSQRDKKQHIMRQYVQGIIDMLPENGLDPHKQKQSAQTQKAHQMLLSASPFYQALFTTMAEKLSLLPPSGAVCGAYVFTDLSTGVWKAPANISLTSVISPCQLVNNQLQQDMTVTPSGKSVNAIRNFIGHGVLIWGARTLAGNDNEWRYINIRRTMNTIEKSIEEALKCLAQEPNDHNLWTTARTMIDNYLMQLWRTGALAGAKPDEAYFVRVGINQTMTYTDIQKGHLIVELGISMRKPAEFTLLKIIQTVSAS